MNKTAPYSSSQIPELSGSQTRESASAARGKWLLSLADLVTLLLAVILVTAQFQQLPGTPDSLAKQSDGSPSAVGTAFAISPEQARREVVNFYLSDFEQSNGQLTEEAANQLRLLNESTKEEPTFVRLKSCFPADKEQGEMSWHRSLSQVLTLYRQVFDGSHDSSRRSVAVLGPHCEGIKAADGANTPAVQVEMFWKAKRHG